MPKNIFEGARRLFQVVFAVAAVVGMVAAWNAEPYARLMYQIQSPGALPVMVERCGNDDAREYLYRVGPEGRLYNIDLCFKTVEDERLSFIPYATDAGRTSWIEFNNSSQVRSYTKVLARSFDIPGRDHSAALEVWRKAKRQARFESGAQLAVQLAAFWLCCYLTGWIARRLLGSATGKGHRQSI